MSDASAVEVPKHVIDFLSEQKTMTLATCNPGAVPHASTYLYVNDGPRLFFWSRPGTTSTRQLEQNPLVAFTIDQYTEDLRQTRGVQGTGECRVLLNGEQIARVADLFGQRFPELSPGNTMSISFFEIVPTELSFIDNSAAGAETTEGEFGATFHRERAFSVFDDLPLSSGNDGINVQLQVHRAEAGELVVREGGPADKFFILTEGEVEVVHDAGGRDEVVATLGAGHFFGEVAVMRDQPRTASLRATQPSILLAMDRDQFREIVADSLGTTAQFEQVIAGRLEALGGS